MPGDAQGVTVPLSTLGGLVTEPTPPDCPEGVSPDCQDVVFLPGSVSQRPCLKKIFASGLNGSYQVIYNKTFVQPNEVAMNLYLDRFNSLWNEFPFTAPGVYGPVQDFSINPGEITQAQSVTAFGREYIACSDGKHGAHVPLQYDGTYLDRVSQDGPGAGPAVSEHIASAPIAVAGDLAQVTSATIAASPTGLVEVGNIVTVLLSTAAPTGMISVGDKFNISGAGVAAYNGTWTIATINNIVSGAGTSFTFVHTTAGLAASGGGSLNWPYVKVTIDSGTPTGLFGVADAGFAVGRQIRARVAIAGAGVANYNGTWPIKYLDGTPSFFIAISTFSNANSSGTTATSVGGISAGVHKAVTLFQTRQGYITQPSPIMSWTATGTKRVTVQVPIGPANVVSRIVAFTGAGGGNFFYIPVDQAVLGVASTVVPDNTTEQVSFDFDDNALFAATAIDIPGRNYFAMTPLADALGVFSYASRLFWWGERQVVNSFLNMGFEGGRTATVPSNPLGWQVKTAGGAILFGGAWTAGFYWSITGDGTANPIGQIQQGAWQDSYGLPILQPNTQYSFRLWAKASATTTGNIIAEIGLNGGAALATATIPISSVTTRGGFLQADFSALTPAVIDPNTVLRVYESGAGAGKVISLDELKVIPTVTPYRDTVFRCSYVNAPEQFDGVTGVLGSTSDTTPIRNCIQLRNTMYFNTASGKNSTTDNGTGEPSTWSVFGVSQSVGSVSIHGSDPGRVGTGESGEQWEFSISENGLYIFAGSGTDKISQEIQLPCENGKPGWNSINKAALSTAWVKNDLINRRCYIGVPVGSATAPNVIFVLDYRDLGVPSEIADKPPFRISLSGKVVASDLSRKWTRWNIAANCGELLARGVNDYKMTFGAGVNFGNSYTLDGTLLTDDDYGQVTPYYTTYFFPNPEVSQALGLDYHRLLASYVSIFIDGVGNTSITPLSGSLTNAYPAFPAYPLVASIPYSYEWGMNVTGERIALKIGSVPATGTDNGFTLQDLAMTLKKDPIAPLRGAM